MRRPRKRLRPTATFEELSQKLRSIDPAEVYGQLVWWAKNKGYKQGWIYYKFKRIIGSIPDYDELPKRYVVHPSHDLLLMLMFLQKEQRREYDRKRRLLKAAGEDPGHYSRAALASSLRSRTWYDNDE